MLSVHITGIKPKLLFQDKSILVPSIILNMVKKCHSAVNVSIIQNWNMEMHYLMPIVASKNF